MRFYRENLSSVAPLGAVGNVGKYHDRQEDKIMDKKGKERIKQFVESKREFILAVSNAERVDNCSRCSADLKYLSAIYRIDFKWYCHKCYKKYIMEDKKNGNKK